MTVYLYTGDVVNVLRRFDDGFVHMVVTSPPYWALRDYGLPPQVWGSNNGCNHEWSEHLQPPRGGISHPSRPANTGGNRLIQTMESIRGGGSKSAFCIHCAAWYGRLGLEPTPDLYIQHMVEIFREVRRVLRDDGTVWLNMGDSYAANRGYQVRDSKHVDVGNTMSMSVPDGAKPLDLLGIPWRLALALQADGWYLRSDICWQKTSPMPESVEGWRWERHRIKVKSADVDWREEARDGDHPVETAVNHMGGGNTGLGGSGAPPLWEECPGCAKCDPNNGYILRKGAWRPTRSHEYVFLLSKNPEYFCDKMAVMEPSVSTDSGCGFRNPRDVWTISTKVYKGSHFATFPPALITPPIKAGTSERGVCAQCGSPWVRVVEGSPTTHTIGWRPSCSCGVEDTVPAIVLDPFIGSGTAGLVAAQLGRDCIGIDLKAEYIEMARERLEKEGVEVVWL